MSYRDDLDAAFARIAQLEAQLGQVDTGATADLAPLLQKITALEGQLRQSQAQLKQRTAAVEEQLRVVLEQAAPELPTLAEYNRAFPPVVGGRPAGVLCPRCQALGDAVEMVVDAPLSMLRGLKVGMEGTVKNDSVLCPRCLYLQALRRR